MSETIALAAAGDISLGDHPAFVSVGVRSRFRRLAASDADYPFGGVRRLLKGNDLVFGNLETVLSDAGLRPGDLRSSEMRGDPDAVPRLASAGFNVLNVANNHILQHGGPAFYETVDRLRNSGISVVGLAGPGGRHSVPAVVTINGVRVAFLGYAFEPDKYFSGRPLYAFGPLCDIPADIAHARDHADVIVCSMHWGDEFIRRPPVANVALAHRIIDAGAHLVLGHHPHVYHGIERYRHGVIAYSLGNFVFDMLWHKWLRYGLVLTARLSRRGVEELHTNFVEIGADYQPRAVAGDADLVADLDTMSATIADHDAEDRYQAEYRHLVRQNRLRCYLHVFRHSHRYESRMLRQILKRPLAARLSGS